MINQPNLIHLPLSGDLYRPPTFDENGQIIQREDTVAPIPEGMNASVLGRMSGDVAPMLMAEIARLQAAEGSK